MQAGVDAARLLTWRAAWMARQGKPFEHAEGSMSKLVAKIFTIFEGTSEIQRMLIGRAITGLEVR